MNYWMTVVALFSRCGEKERVRFPFLRTLRRERGGGGNGERFDYGGGELRVWTRSAFPSRFSFSPKRHAPSQSCGEEGGGEEERRSSKVIGRTHRVY